MNPPDEPWQCAERTRGGQRVTVRWQPFPPASRRASHPHCLSLLWKFGPQAASGEPTDQEARDMQTLDERLRADLGETAVLSVVVVGKGHAEFVYHASSANDFVGRLEALTEIPDPEDLRVSHFFDPTWQHAERLLQFFDVAP